MWAGDNSFDGGCNRTSLISAASHDPPPPPLETERPHVQLKLGLGQANEV